MSPWLPSRNCPENHQPSLGAIQVTRHLGVTGTADPQHRAWHLHLAQGETTWSLEFSSFVMGKLIWETHGNSWKIMEHHLLIVLEVYWWARRVFCITFFLNEVCKSWADEAWSAANHSGPVRSCSTGNIAMANLRYPVFSLAWLVYIIYVNPHLWQNISKY